MSPTRAANALLGSTNLVVEAVDCYAGDSQEKDGAPTPMIIRRRLRRTVRSPVCCIRWSERRGRLLRSLLLEDWDADDWLLYEEAMFTSPGLHYGSRLPRDERRAGFWEMLCVTFHCRRLPTLSSGNVLA